MESRFRLQFVTRRGMLRLAAFSALLMPVAALLHATETPPAFVWSLYDDLSVPSGVAADALGNIYVTDRYHFRIQKFDANGTPLLKWGEYGWGNGQFQGPYGITVESAGDVYVAEWVTNRVQKFHADGTFVMTFGSLGSGVGQFNYPSGVAVNASGNIYVADRNNHRIQEFDRNGAFLRQWGSFGTADGEFKYPYGIALDSGGNVYVADHQNYRVQKFDATGAFLKKWGSSGTGNGQFAYLLTVAVDSSDNVYTGDVSNVQKFDRDGVFLSKWGGAYGTGDGQFSWPAGITVHGGAVYVADMFNDRIQKFAYPDNTPPVISPSVSPPPNAADWNRTEVTVSWSVADPESGIASKSGCDTTTLSQNTAGTTLTCSAKNGVGMTASASVIVMLDVTPPVISGLPANCTLWPPNQKMAAVADVSADGSISGLTAFSVTVASNEAVTAADWTVTGPPLGPFHVELRADRAASGTGRVYTLHTAATDLAGNSAAVTTACTVPHDIRP